MVDELFIVYTCKVRCFGMNLFTKTIRFFANNETSEKKVETSGLHDLPGHPVLVAVAALIPMTKIFPCSDVHSNVSQTHYDTTYSRRNSLCHSLPASERLNYP